MRLNLHRRRRLSLERLALWAMLTVCLFIASQPLRERLVAWRSQQLLQARWQEAVLQSAHQRVRKMPSPRLRAISWKPRKSAQTNKKAVQSRGKLVKGQSKSNSKKIVALKEELLPSTTTVASAPWWPMTRLSCSRMKLDAIVVEGTDAAQLQQGPGHEANTSWPGGQNCVIAAHRNAYGWWFYGLNLLRKGDSITLQVPDCKFIYRVVATRTVSVKDTSILDWQVEAPPRLTLYTCTLPKTKQRLVVVADLQKTQPL